MRRRRRPRKDDTGAQFPVPLQLKDAGTVCAAAKELNVAADYMYLQQMRFGERIRYELDCKARQELVMVPAFTFQPLVENAIIHGIAPKEEGGSIRIVVRQKENRRA